MRLAAILFITIAAATGVQAQTYSEQIAPILFEHCVECHRPGEAAPFSLLTYEDARKRASQIAKVTHSRYMPPWPPEPGYGEFAGARRLTAAQIEQISNWAARGAPEGDRLKTPTAPRFTAGWKLGRPDLIVKLREPFLLQASKTDVFRNFILPVELKEARYVRAIEVHPGNPKLVHHANVIVDRTRSFRRRDGEDGEAGFPGMEVETESGGNGFDPDSHFLFWKPGTAAQPEPEDMAWTLYPNSDLVVNLHLQPSGKPETIQPEIGLYFTDRAPARRPILVQLEHDGAIDIAPGAGNFAVTDEWKLPVEARVLAIYPHAHYIGKRVECWAILPSGKRVELIRIEAWDINWQAVYAYRKPVDLPANTRVMMRITYDNRGSTKRVKAGNRSEDEMGHVWLQLLPVHDGKDDVDPRLTIQISVMRRRLEKYPADFMAHYNLGAALQSLGQSAESLPYLEKAARLKPANVAARNTLGVAYMIADRLDRAIPEFQEVLKLQPAYTQARFNLALALAAQNDADGAIREFEVFLGTEPDDAKAQSEMAKALVKTGRVREAIPHFQKAAELLRNDAGAWTNLGAALAMTRDYAAAIAAFETALKIEPDHPQARANLARAKADKGKL